MDAAAKAGEQIAAVTGQGEHPIAVVLGSGWGGSIRSIGKVRCLIPTSELAGFRAPSVAGHAGCVYSLDVDGRNVLAFAGRTHLYEGHGVNSVLHPIKVAKAAGVKTLILTNGAGAVNMKYYPGETIVLSDHINNTGASALEGARFVDMSHVYSPRLRHIALEAGGDHEGVYMANHGPAYETPAEVRMAAAIGADLVGMSTVLEATWAVAEGLEVLGLTLVTNMAAGISDSLNHEEVVAVGKEHAVDLGQMLARIVKSA